MPKICKYLVTDKVAWFSWDTYHCKVTGREMKGSEQKVKEECWNPDRYCAYEDCPYYKRAEGE